ncbi:MAG TPA: hypothetical protein VNR18_04200 [Hyphomicrobiales bacterium]|nr:hypothetical protein [Hyphomicrobiales bacterium]
MADVVDFCKRRESRRHAHKEARADALRDRLAASREEAAAKDPQQRAKAPRRLLDMFKNPPPRKR